MCPNETSTPTIPSNNYRTYGIMERWSFKRLGEWQGLGKISAFDYSTREALCELFSIGFDSTASGQELKVGKKQTNKQTQGYRSQ